MASIIRLKSMVKKYLLLTRFLALMGEAYIRHMACPSSPIMSMPIIMAINEAGKR